jgi:mannose-6-phosphate isomerase class I
VECDKFVLDRWTVAAGSMDTIFPADDRFHIVTVLQGTAELNHPEIEAPLERGQTVLLPAVRESLALQLSGDAILLDMWIAPK